MDKVLNLKQDLNYLLGMKTIDPDRKEAARKEGKFQFKKSKEIKKQQKQQ